MKLNRSFSAAVLMSVGITSICGSMDAAETTSLERQMLTHVEKVLVLDTINVDKYEFFRHYRLNPSAGSILPGEQVRALLKGVSMPEEFTGSPFTGFTNEFNDYLIYAQQDTTGYLRLAESSRLIDGTWSEPEFTPAVLNTGIDDDDTPVEANAAFPFMADDGQTLYFASDNTQSLGGYDIFVATKDPSDGDFLIPGNLGMPFNSPYDDYMLVLDSQAGVGWWASDRNQLEDQITIYIYALTDERVNVDPDDPQLETYASLSGWEALLDEEQQAARRRLLSELPTGRATAAVQAPDFILPVPGGRQYKYFSDFKNTKAASKMQLYQGQKAALEKKEAELAALRKQYAGGDRKAGDRILSLEEQLRTDSDNLRELLSEIYRLEFN